MKIKEAIVMFFLLIISNNLFAQNNLMVVCKPVVDLRIKPEDPAYKKEDREINYPVFCNDTYNFKHENNPEQDSQLLLGDKLILKECCGEWLKVCVLEQREYRQCKWVGKVGYIKKDEAVFVSEFGVCNLVVNKQWAKVYSMNDKSSVLYNVSIGTKFSIIFSDQNKIQIILPDGKHGLISSEDVCRVFDDVQDIERVRTKLSTTIMEFLFAQYSWGGRSAFDLYIKKQQTGVDCSSLVNLIYRSVGFEIPRDSSDQYFFSNRINGNEVFPGDLIFFESGRRNGRMKHVMIYLGNGLVFEVTGHIPFESRFIKAKDLLGKPIEEIKSGDEFNGEKIYFGSFLNDGSEFDYEKIKKMRSFFMSSFNS